MIGEPEDIGGISRKKRRGQILKYGKIEFHFDGDRGQDHLFLIYREKWIGDQVSPDLSVNFETDY